MFFYVYHESKTLEMLYMLYFLNFLVLNLNDIRSENYNPILMTTVHCASNWVRKIYFD